MIEWSGSNKESFVGHIHHLNHFQVVFFDKLFALNITKEPSELD